MFDDIWEEGAREGGIFRLTSLGKTRRAEDWAWEDL